MRQFDFIGINCYTFGQEFNNNNQWVKMISEKVFSEKSAAVALKDDQGRSLTYGDLRDFSRGFNDYFKLRSREFVLVLCENTVPCAAFFYGCLANKVIPLLLNSEIDREMLQRYLSIYRSNYIFKPEKAEISGAYSPITTYYDYELLKVNATPVPVYEELSFLLPTSGTTGNPKLVRHSYHNINLNAANVAQAFGLCGDECALLSLPLHFTQGLSVLCSHLSAGARVFLTDAPLNSRVFWNAMKNEGITSFTGVPFSYEVLDKLRFYRMELPDLKVISQGGGRMPDELFTKLSAYAASTGRKFYATYGATETTARMSCLPPENAAAKCGSIGKPLQGYRMWLVDEQGGIIENPGETGELVFQGGSVTLGYADNAADLTKGDERHGVYQTGDLAYRDAEGFYYIVGRLSRFVKIFGYRINLDETERLLKSEFNGAFACTGNDEKLYLFTSEKSLELKELTLFLKKRLKLNIAAFEGVYLDEIPKKRSGKTDYGALARMINLRANRNE